MEEYLVPKKFQYLFTICLSANLLSNTHMLIYPDLCVKTTYLNFSQRLSTFIVARVKCYLDYFFQGHHLTDPNWVAPSLDPWVCRLFCLRWGFTVFFGGGEYHLMCTHTGLQVLQRVWCTH